MDRKKGWCLGERELYLKCGIRLQLVSGENFSDEWLHRGCLSCQALHRSKCTIPFIQSYQVSRASLRRRGALKLVHFCESKTHQNLLVLKMSFSLPKLTLLQKLHTLSTSRYYPIVLNFLLRNNLAT